jgi:hypothetical protein
MFATPYMGKETAETGYTGLNLIITSFPGDMPVPAPAVNEWFVVLVQFIAGSWSR